jgi:hypothetical protein
VARDLARDMLQIGDGRIFADAAFSTRQHADCISALAICLLISNRRLMAPNEDDFRIRPGKDRNRGGGQKAARRIGAACGRPTSFRRRRPTVHTSGWRQSENRDFCTGKGAGRFNPLAGRAHVKAFSGSPPPLLSIIQQRCCSLLLDSETVAWQRQP